jgi:hypothetical protein
MKDPTREGGIWIRNWMRMWAHIKQCNKYENLLAEYLAQILITHREN